MLARGYHRFIEYEHAFVVGIQPQIEKFLILRCIFFSEESVLSPRSLVKTLPFGLVLCVGALSFYAFIQAMGLYSKLTPPDDEHLEVRYEGGTGAPEGHVLSGFDDAITDSPRIQASNDLISGAVFLEYRESSPFSDIGFIYTQTTYYVEGEFVGYRNDAQGNRYGVFLVEKWTPSDRHVLTHDSSLWMLFGVIFVLVLFVAVIIRRSSD